MVGWMDKDEGFAGRGGANTLFLLGAPTDDAVEACDAVRDIVGRPISMGIVPLSETDIVVELDIARPRGGGKGAFSLPTRLTFREPGKAPIVISDIGGVELPETVFLEGGGLGGVFVSARTLFSAVPLGEESFLATLLLGGGTSGFKG